MEQYTVTIEELVAQDFTVDAESKEAAVQKAMQLYQQGALVLAPGNLEMKRIAISDDADWIEF